MKRILSTAIVTALLATLFVSGCGVSDSTTEENVISGGDSEKEESVPSNPLVKETVTTWDCVYFGNYWQNDTNGDGTVDQNDEKQPIKWRVLSVDGDDAFLLADEILDCQPYNEENTDVTWETCTLRNWLNTTFLNSAFSETEQSAIKNTTVVNKANQEYGTAGGNTTTDQVYLLSSQEACNTAYGFDNDWAAERNTREAYTTYADECGAHGYIGCKSSAWWLRDRDRSDDDYALVVYLNGGANHFFDIYGGSDGYGDGIAVRPALHLNLSSSSWKAAGKVTAREEESSSDAEPTTH